MPPQLLEQPPAPVSDDLAEPEPALTGEVLDAPGDRLDQLERVIANGLAAFLAAGEALGEIHDGKLYEAAGHQTWAGYLGTRWGISEARAHQLMNSAATARALRDAGAELPPNEAGVRELTPAIQAVGVERVVPVWQQILTAGGKITAKKIRAALRDAGLPVAGHGQGDRHVVRLDQVASTLAALRSRVERLHSEREQRQLDPDELERLAGEAEALSELLHQLAQPPRSPRPTPEPLPDDEICLDHGARRLPDGRCARCGRHDLTEAQRVRPAALAAA